MKIGRNDPCPCGSGKKYKKCCLKSEMEEKTARLLEEKAREEAERERWNRFKKASQAGKLAILRDYLDTASSDDDDVFNMAAAYCKEGRKLGEYDGFSSLVHLIKERQPEIYRGDAAFYIKYLVENMALQEDFTGLAEALEPFAEYRGDIDAFFRVIELLMYYGRTDALVDVMERAHPLVMESSDVIPYGKDEFSTLLGWLIIFKSSGDLELKELYQRVSRYWDISWKAFREKVVPLISRDFRSWRKEDFNVRMSWEGIDEGLRILMVELMALMHERGMDLSRALLARNTLMEYIFNEYHHPEGTIKSVFLLLPLRRSLDSFLAEFLNPLNDLPYRVMAVMEALPFYLEFLHIRGLIEKEERERTMDELRPLKEDVVRVFSSNPRVVSSIERAWKR